MTYRCAQTFFELWELVAVTEIAELSDPQRRFNWPCDAQWSTDCSSAGVCRGAWNCSLRSK